MFEELFGWLARRSILDRDDHIVSQTINYLLQILDRERADIERAKRFIRITIMPEVEGVNAIFKKNWNNMDRNKLMNEIILRLNRLKVLILRLSKMINEKDNKILSDYRSGLFVQRIQSIRELVSLRDMSSKKTELQIFILGLNQILIDLQNQLGTEELMVFDEAAQVGVVKKMGGPIRRR